MTARSRQADEWAQYDADGAREGMGRDGASTGMSVDEALEYANTFSSYCVTGEAFNSLATEVRRLSSTADSESITAIAIQIDGKPVYLPTWCADRMRKALEVSQQAAPAVFDMERSQPTTVPEAAVEAGAEAFNLYRAFDAERRIRAALTAALPHLQPDMEALRRDAERWRHARKLLTVDDIEGAQGAYDSFGRLTSEEECRRADAAMDAAIDDAMAQRDTSEGGEHQRTNAVASSCGGG